MTTTTRIDIRSEDNKFQKEAIREALEKPVTERRAREIGHLYDDLATDDVTVTTYFHAWGWYHITNVEAPDQPTEDSFWSRLENIVNSNPRVMSGL